MKTRLPDHLLQAKFVTLTGYARLIRTNDRGQRTSLWRRKEKANVCGTKTRLRVRREAVFAADHDDGMDMIRHDDVLINVDVVVMAGERLQLQFRDSPNG